jgi:hypothetical protein
MEKFGRDFMVSPRVGRAHETRGGRRCGRPGEPSLSRPGPFLAGSPAGWHLDQEGAVRSGSAIAPRMTTTARPSGPPVSISSRKLMNSMVAPLTRRVLDSLASWRRETPYAAAGNWVFAIPRMNGKMPYWSNTLVARHFTVGAQKAGISVLVSWHTLRLDLYLDDRRR